MEIRGNPYLVCVLTENNRAVELRLEGKRPYERTGTVLTAMVERIASNIEAAFLRGIGDNRYYLPLKYAPSGLKCGETIPVQIIREKAGQKLCSVSANLSLTGRYFVASQGGSCLKVSGKLSKEEQEKLLVLVRSFPNYQKYCKSLSVMIRTNASHASKEELEKEFDHLSETLKKISATGSMRSAGCILYEPDSFYIEMLRDLPEGSLDEIVTDLSEVKEQIALWQETSGARLPDARFYQDRLLPFYRLLGLGALTESLLEKKVWLKSGGFLIIQQTEAFAAIDVNSGKNIARKEKEETVFRLNMEAADEISRQIRLRNLSGIILVDFVNMEKPEHLKLLKDEMERLLLKDRGRSQVVDITRLQIMEITRKKTSPPIEEIIKKSAISRECD